MMDNIQNNSQVYCTPPSVGIVRCSLQMGGITGTWSLSMRTLGAVRHGHSRRRGTHGGAGTTELQYHSR
jgi:hypothetical protein